MSKKKTYEEVKDLIYSKNIVLVTDKTEYKNVDSKLIGIDENDYIVTFTLNHLIRDNRKPPIVNFSNPFSLYNMKRWLVINNKPFKIITEQTDCVSKQTLTCQCNINKTHTWNTTWNILIKNTGCPYCSGRYADNINNLLIKNSELCKEWNYKKNDKYPKEYTPNSNKEVWWMCEQGHEWSAVISSRNRGCGCPYCSGHLVSKDYNFEICHLELLVDWNYDTNNPPNIYTPCSSSEVEWICHVCHSFWKARIADRCNGSGCPYCSGKMVNHTNCLAEIRPDLIKEWDYELNSISPYEVTCGSKKIASWICSENPKHKWNASITSRNRGSGCPYCIKYSGEEKIKDFLYYSNINFQRQYVFKDCKHITYLKFDFAILDINDNTLLMIEYDGIGHYEPVRFNGMSLEKAKEIFELQKIKDTIKNEYCLKNNIPLLRIHYKQFNDIESILLAHLKQ